MATILLDRPQASWLALLAMVAALALIVWTDRSIRMHVGIANRMVLALLRIVALFGLALSLLQPVLSWTRIGSDRGVVAILVDKSASMSVVDAQRGPAEQVELAAALGKLPSGVRDPNLSQLAAAIEKAQSAREQFNRATSELAYAKLARLTETNAAQRIQKLAAETEHDRLAAWQLCRSIPIALPIQTLIDLHPGASTQSADGSNGFGPALAAVHQLQAQADQAIYDRRDDVRSICRELANASRISLAQQAIRSSGGVLEQCSGAYQPSLFVCGNELLPLGTRQSASADDPSTNLVAALRDLRRRLVGQRLAAVVLFTDGRQSEGVTPDLTAAGETPLFAVQVAAAEAPDLAVNRIEAMPSIRLHESMPISVELTARSMSKAEAMLTLSSTDQQENRLITFARPTTQENFEFAFDHPGINPISASLESQPGEATDRNNKLMTTINVTDDVSDVCLINGVVDETARSLQQTLSRMPGLVLTTVDATTKIPTLEQLAAADSIILHDVPAAALNELTWAALREAVNERGANLLIISDSEDLFADYQESPAIRPLLPWSDEQSPSLQSWPGNKPSIQILPTDRSAANAFLLTHDMDQNRAAWRKMPPVSQTLTLPPPQSGSHSLLIESESHAPVMTETWLGAGRVLILGCNELWRWNNVATEPGMFWKRLAEFTSGPGFVADDGELGLDVNHALLTTDQTLLIRTRMREVTDSELDDVDEPPLLRITRAGSSVSSWNLPQPMDRSSRRAQFRLPDLTAGAYSIEFSWGRHALSLNVTVNDPIDAEMRNVSGDDAFLQNLIGPNGARIQLNDLPSLKSRIDAVSSPAPVVGRYRLWDSPYLFTLVVACLCLEWSLRNGLSLP